MADKAPQTAFFIRHTTSAGILAVTLLAILMASAFYWQQRVVNQSRNWVLHTYEVTSQIDHLSDKLKAADINHRGYMLTGSQKYKDAYLRVVEGNPGSSVPADESRTIFAQIKQLRALVADNSLQLHEIDEIEGATKTLLDYWATTIQLKEEDPANVSPNGIAERTTPLLEQASRSVDQMVAEEARLLALRSKSDQIRNDQNHSLTFLIMGIFYAGMVGAVWLAAGQWRHGRHMESQVSEKTGELVKTNDKLQQANSELAESRAFLKNIINHVADPIFVKDKQHRWIDGNSAFWSLMGRPEEEVRGRSDYDFFSKEQADVFWEKDEEVFKGGRSNINIESLTDASGVTHIISTKKARFEGPSNEVYLVGVIRDITELTRMQDKLKESDEARLKSIMDHSGRPVYIKDLQGKYLQVNRELLTILGRDEKEVLGHTDYDFFPPYDARVYRQNDDKVAQQALAIEFEETIPHADGTHTYTSVKFPLYDANDNIYAVCGILNDITDRKLVEAKLARYMHELERSNQELDDFAYIASHDLKEPLRGLNNHATFLREDYEAQLGEDGVQRLKRLGFLAQRMEHLVNDLLYFSRLGRTELAIQPTDPNLMVHEIEQLMEGFLKERNASISVSHPMPRVVCDRPRITEVFRNLITNAVKYNDKPERIVEVGYTENPEGGPAGVEQGAFYVKDNGIGINPEFHEEIFRIFKRLPGPAHDKEGGTGAGLTFVKKIIERHKGHIWLTSKQGEGTIFYFTVGKRDV